MSKAFLKSISHFLRKSMFSANLSASHNYFFVYIYCCWRYSKKALCQGLHCSFYRPFEVTLLHIHSCCTLFLAGKNTHLIVQVKIATCIHKFRIHGKYVCVTVSCNLCELQSYFAVGNFNFANDCLFANLGKIITNIYSVFRELVIHI